MSDNGDIELMQGEKLDNLARIYGLSRHVESDDDFRSRLLQHFRFSSDPPWVPVNCRCVLIGQDGVKYGGGGAGDSGRGVGGGTGGGRIVAAMGGAGMKTIYAVAVGESEGDRISQITAQMCGRKR